MDACAALDREKTIWRKTRSSSAMSLRERTWVLVLAAPSKDHRGGIG
jgi:hypothetical protein